MEGPDPKERRRYIGFRVTMAEGPPPDRRAMVEAMDAACGAARLPDMRRLTVFSGELGIAKCLHREKRAMLRALGSIERIDGRPAQVETLVTSGTIKKVKAHLGPGVDG